MELFELNINNMAIEFCRLGLENRNIKLDYSLVLRFLFDNLWFLYKTSQIVLKGIDDVALIEIKEMRKQPYCVAIRICDLIEHS